MGIQNEISFAVVLCYFLSLICIEIYRTHCEITDGLRTKNSEFISFHEKCQWEQKYNKAD